MHALGSFVKVLHTIDYRPHATLVVGDTGMVVWVDIGTQEVTIALDKFHEGLSHWHNTISYVRGEADDVEPHLAFSKIPPEGLKPCAVYTWDLVADYAPPPRFATG